MSKISTYEVVPVPKLADKLIGTSVGGEIEDATYNFTLQELLDLFIPLMPANNLQGILDFGNTATQDINLFGTITTTYLDVTDTANLYITYLNEETHIVGSVFDSLDLVGTPGQVLTSTGDGVEWFTLPPIFTPNLEQVLTEGNTSDIDIILDANLEALDISSDTATVGVNLTLDGTITDGMGSVGASGNVLSSTVTGIEWVALPVYSATSPLLFNSATGVFSIQQATSSQNGYLSSSDWITFDGKQNAGNYITALTGEATASGPGSATVTLSNSAVIGKVLTGFNPTAGTINASDSILTAFGKTQSQINALVGGVQYQGVWNASTNVPTLVSSVGVQGHYYVVNVAGNTNLNGITDWQIGDWAIFSESVWQKVDNTDSVTSVNGFTGAVSLTTDNIPEGTTNLYYLDSRARAALSFAAGSGAYNNTTGVITIPTNNNQILNGAGYITLGSLSASSPLVYNNLTGAFSIPQATTLVDGYLSATDWTTFNNKQNYLGGTGLVKSTAGTITYITDNSGNWNTAYDRSIVSAAVTGTTTKTLTLNEQDGGTITASWTDLDTGLTSVGVSMPSAFSVANSPLTSNGTIAVTGAGTNLQYIDGTGALQTFPGLTGFVPYTGATQNVDLGEFGISAGYFQADLTPTGALQVGRMQWNSTDGTMDLRLMGNNVTLQIGQETVTRVVNKSGIDLLEANYQVVRIRKVAEGGAQGQRLAVVLAQGNNENNSTEVLGLVTETINSNQEGFITNFGEVKQINTTGSLQGETWVDGDVVYLSAVTPGQLTNIRPIAPNHAVIVGYVTYAHANNGKIYVSVDTGYELGELHNVYAPNPTANQSIYWNIANSRYELNTIGGILGYTPANAATTISTTAPLQGGGDLSANRTFSITQSGASTDGYLSSTDWNTFNNKQPAGSYVPTSRLLSINGTQYDLSADRSWSVGTVTSVAALTLGTSGTDLSSSVANGTTTPVITLNVPTASAANRGALSAADWSTFNTKVGNVTASSPLFSSGGSTPNLTIQQASGSQNGFLSSTDWTTFNNKQAAGNYITSLTGEATASGPGAASVTLNNAAVTGKVLTGVNITGGSISASDSILTAFGKVQNQINGLIGSTIYQGTWNASTNTPTLTSGVGVRGYYYIVSVAGNTNLDGITDWFVGDWAIFDGTAWQQVDNTDAVVSVNGFTGAVSLTTDNIPEGSTNQYYLNSRARAALSFAAGSGAYNSTTGVITIPTNNNQITNGANYITLASLSGSAPIVYNSGTGAISITQAGTACNGFLSSTDWNTFNNKTSCVGTVTSVAANAGAGISISGSPITTSGTFCITNTAPYSGEAVIVLGAGANSSVRCGVGNTASAQWSAVSGGRNNTASGTYYTTVSGGYANTASAIGAVIGGGSGNTASANWSKIGAGVANIASGNCSFVGAGNINCATANNSTVSGGYNNKATGNCSFIGGGNSGVASNAYSTIAGGRVNTASGTYTFIGGGNGNIANSAYATVAGGQTNCAYGGCSTVGGGWCNVASGLRATVSGGAANNASGAQYPFIGGGYGNTSSGSYGSVVAGGYLNTTSGYMANISGGQSNTASASRSHIGGGVNNIASGGESAVGGGNGNVVSGNNTFIGGGCTNTTSGNCSAIIGGRVNGAAGIYSVVSGGYGNCTNGGQSAVVGGESNYANGCYSFIGGGYNNLSTALESTVSGGGVNYAGGIYSFVGAGICNIICSPTSPCLVLGATIAGGVGNNTTGGTWSLAACDFTVAPTKCVAGQYSFIGGGLQNRATGTHSSVSGGRCNIAGGTYSAVSGGRSNSASGYDAFVGGGFAVSATSSESTAVGGTGVTASAAYSFAGGGRSNSASGYISTLSGGSGNISSGSRATIGGGGANTASGANSTVGGGQSNTASGPCSTIAGGKSNTSSGDYGFVGGGQSNFANAVFATASGGYNNCSCAACATIGGGRKNKALGGFSTIGGGNVNSASGYISTIAGGNSNTASGIRSFVGGGEQNTAQGNCSTAVGGELNTVTTQWSTLVGGYTNSISGNRAFLGGGQANTASGAYFAAVVGGNSNTSSGYASFVGGGSSSTASGARATIAGGQANAASGACSFIGGGCSNNAGGARAAVVGGNNNSVSSNFSTISGGGYSVINKDYSFIGAGYNNTVSGNYSTISGGYQNMICSVSALFGSGLAVIGGGSSNYICGATVCAATIAGGVGGNTTGGTWNGQRFSVAPTVCTAGAFSFIGGGFQNRTTAIYGTVGGGNGNKAIGASYSFVGGGENNSASGNYFATVGGGSGNTASGTVSATIAGGTSNTASGSHGFVGGGQGNISSGACSFLGGGCGNSSSSFWTTVGGGRLNSATTSYATISGGYGNTASGACSVIGGGYYNRALGGFSFVGSGSGSCTTCNYGFLGGGCNNIASGNFHGTVINGQGNSATANYNFVGNGLSNVASGTQFNVVVGGRNNTTSGDYAFIGGGSYNTANSAYSSVLGGCCNSTNSAINAHVIGSCIPAVANNYTFVNNLCQWGGGISDGRRKNTIQDTGFGLDDIVKLRPVSYCWNGDSSCHKKYGFIAQEVQQAMACVVEINPIARVDENGLEVILEQGGSPILQFEKDAIYASYVNAFKEINERLLKLENKS